MNLQMKFFSLIAAVSLSVNGVADSAISGQIGPALPLPTVDDTDETISDPQKSSNYSSTVEGGVVDQGETEVGPPCSQLKMGQYRCDDLYSVLDPDTQQPHQCSENQDGSYLVNCQPIDDLKCEGLKNGTYFVKSVIDEHNPCYSRSTKDFRTALLLSIFFGWLGLDRFYLGYYAIGLFKMCTAGFFFIWHLADVILIALQIVGPADGRAYQIDYFGPRMHRVLFSNLTSITPS